MSYQEKNIIVSLVSTLLIFGYYVLNVLRMNQGGDLQPTAVYSLWATVIALGIIIIILATILAQIAFAIIQYIQTQEEEEFIEDERDKLIDLKGTRNAYYLFSIGVFLAMLTAVFGMPPLVMFNLLLASAFLGAIMGDVSRLFYYWRGV